MWKEILIPLAAIAAFPTAALAGPASSPPIITPPSAAWTGPAASAVATVASPPAAADTLATLAKVCLPVLEGRSLKAAAGAAGFRLEDGVWVLTIQGKREIQLEPPDQANPRVCGATIESLPQSAPVLTQTLAAWANAQTPPLTQVEQNVTSTSGDETWTTSSWSGKTAAGVEEVVLTHGQPQHAGSSAGGLSRSELLVTITPA